MNPLSFAPLGGALLNILLTALVIISDRKSRINRVFFLWGLSITVWNIGTFVLFQTPPDPAYYDVAFFWARFLQFGVIFIPVTLFHLSLLLAKVEAKRTVTALYIVAICLALTNFTPFFIKGVRHMGYAYYSIAGPGFWIFSLTFGATVVSIYVLITRRRALRAHSRKQLDGLIVAQTVLVLLGTNDILPILGQDHYPFTEVVIFPYGSIAAVFYGAVVGYCTLQHQLLNVHLTLGKFAAHLVRFLFLFAIALVLLLLIASKATVRFELFHFYSLLFVVLVSTLTASILFPRLFGGAGMEKWERRILGDHFEYQDQVRDFIESMPLYAEVPALLENLHTHLLHTFSLRGYKIILREETNRVFTLARAHPDEKSRQFKDMDVGSPVFRYFERSESEYLVLSRSHAWASTRLMERQAREQLAEFDADLCFPLAWQEELFGLLLVDRKVADAPFTATDVNLLVDLAKSMSVVVNQIRLKTQILQAQELDLLGRMSRGMAHDLNNLLTPVSTLLQLASETGTCDEELLPTALRNLTLMRAYIRESLFFSEHPTPDFKRERLDVLVEQSVELAASQKKKRVEIIAETPGETYVEMNSVLMQRAFTNIISNAVDASQPGSQIRVQLEKLVKTEATRDWFRVRVIDHGEGISPENLARVQMPYFTTKNRGDETRGFGLGLSICRKIVTLHGGHLSIESQLSKGTSVQVDLPSRQRPASTPVNLTASAAP